MTETKPLDPLRSLSDISELARLPEVCERFDIEITAFGSVVRRLAFLMQSGKAETMPSLFDLAPFLSDIDIKHSGKPEQTPAIRAAIMAAVPWSECFRWEISSETTLKPYGDDEAYLPIIPLNKLTLPTRAGTGFVDPFHALDDIETGRFRLMANPFYERSALRAAHRDCELLHAIFFLELLCEHGTEESMTEHPGWQTCMEIIRRTDYQTSISIGESAHLRARLRYRFQSLYAACGNVRKWEVAFIKSGLDEILRGRGLLNRYDYGFFSNFDRRFLGVSCRLGGDRYRLGYELVDVLFEKFTRNQGNHDGLIFWDFMLETHQPLSGLSAHPLPQLASGQVIVGASYRLKVNEGSAPSATSHEHIHLEISLSPGDASVCAEVSHEDLGVIVVLSCQENSEEDDEVRPYSCAFPFPSACIFQSMEGNNGSLSHVIRARINFGRILEVFPRIVREAGYQNLPYYFLQVFVVAEYEK